MNNVPSCCYTKIVLYLFVSYTETHTCCLKISQLNLDWCDYNTSLKLHVWLKIRKKSLGFNNPVQAYAVMFKLCPM